MRALKMPGYNLIKYIGVCFGGSFSLHWVARGVPRAFCESFHTRSPFTPRKNIHVYLKSKKPKYALCYFKSGSNGAVLFLQMLYRLPHLWLQHIRTLYNAPDHGWFGRHPAVVSGIMKKNIILVHPTGMPHKISKSNCIDSNSHFIAVFAVRWVLCLGVHTCAWFLHIHSDTTSLLLLSYHGSTPVLVPLI